MMRAAACAARAPRAMRRPARGCPMSVVARYSTRFEVLEVLLQLYLEFFFNTRIALNASCLCFKSKCG